MRVQTVAQSMSCCVCRVARRVRVQALAESVAILDFCPEVVFIPEIGSICYSLLAMSHTFC